MALASFDWKLESNKCRPQWSPVWRQMVMIFSFSVALPAGYLKPSQLNQPNGNGVCAQPCSKPNTCYPSGCTASCCAFHPAPRPLASLPVELPSCLGTCDNKCYPDCDPECCSEPQQAPYTAGGVTALASAPPSITCPGACHFTCYPECSPQCCASQYVPNPCHASCPCLLRAKLWQCLLHR